MSVVEEYEYIKCWLCSCYQMHWPFGKYWTYRINREYGIWENDSKLSRERKCVWELRKWEFSYMASKHWTYTTYESSIRDSCCSNIFVWICCVNNISYFCIFAGLLECETDWAPDRNTKQRKHECKFTRSNIQIDGNL